MIKIAIVVVLAVFVCSTIASSCPDWGIRQYDYLLLSMTYPLTFCMTKHCIESRVKNYFTTHGLWPNLREPIHGKMWPQCCDNGNHLRFDDLRNTYGQNLTNLWPDVLLEEPYSADGLWSHEWTKHGTCSEMPQMNYFGKALDLRMKYDISAIFSQYGIQRDNTRVQSISTMMSAIRSAVGTIPVITCENVNGNTYIFEVQLCFSKTFELIDCPIATHCQTAIYPKTLKRR